MHPAPRPTAALVVVAALALALVLGAVPAGAQTPQSSESARTSKIAKLDFPATTQVAGQEALVTGKLTVARKAKRKVLLQMRVPFSGWRTVDTDKTSKKGRFKLVVPTSYYHKKLAHRVVVPRTRRAAAITSKSHGIRVNPPFVPGGQPSSWAPILENRTIRYDPCTTVTYRVNLQGTADPAARLADVQSAVAQISAATGIRYRYLGSTDKIFGALPGVGAKGWPKKTNLIVTFANRAQMDAKHPLTDATGTAPGKAGWGGQEKLLYARGKGGRILRTVRSGVVISNELPYANGFGRDPIPSTTYAHIGGVILHELGHAAGLGHTPAAAVDEEEIMDVTDATLYQPLTYGAGDLTGLEKVGFEQGCMKVYRGRESTAPVPVPPALP